jgi:hypothetical protein
MTRVTVFFLLSCGAAIAAGCGSNAVTTGSDNGLDAAADSSMRADASPTTDASASRDSAAPLVATDAGLITISCLSALTCPDREVCCTTIGLKGVDVACAPECSAFSLQLCLTSAECPIGRECMKAAISPTGYCSRAVDAGPGTTDGGEAPGTDGGELDGGDSGSTPDGASRDSGATDGGTSDGATDGGTGDSATDGGTGEGATGADAASD